jgi:hypothetical protein
MAGLDTIVARVSSIGEAHIIVGLLQANGISATVSSDDMGGADPQLQLVQGVRVIVAADDDDEARSVIAQAEADGRS